MQDSTCRPCSSVIPDPTLPETGFTPEQAAVLALFGLPRCVWLILAIMHRSSDFANHVALDFVELFLGQAACTNAFLKAGCRAIPYDVFNDVRYQDLNCVLGMISALQHMRQLAPGYGLVWFGAVCSTWVFMTRSSTMRT